MNSTIKRILAVALAVSMLVAGLVASQLRTPPRKVSGFVEADEIRLGSRVGGRVEEVLTTEGARVTRGQKLIQLEPFDLRQQEKEAEATLAARQADYDRLSAGYREEEMAEAQARYEQLEARLRLLKNGPREQEIEAARARKDVAEAELVLAQQEFGRLKRLVEQNAVARQEFDRVDEQLKSARSMVVVRTRELEILQQGTRQEEIDEAQAKLDEAEAARDQTLRGYRVEEIAQAQAARDAAHAALDAVRQRIDELTIRSPVDGLVEALELQPGDLVQAGAPVLSLMDCQRLWIRAYVPEDQLNLTVGQELGITVDSYPGQRFAAQLSFISRQAEFTPSNIQTPDERAKQVFRIKVTLTEGTERLRPGMAADVWLDPT
jgi:multidrug resistance efflux pump